MSDSPPVSEARERNLKTIRAICALRPEGVKYFFREALELMSDDQLNQLMQLVGEWLSKNPPRKG